MLTIGEIYRYGDGSTAFCRLHSRHVGGFHAEQHFGGFLFVLTEKLTEATEEEKRKFEVEEAIIKKRRYE